MPGMQLQIIVLTGASRGIGVHIAQSLAKPGVRLVLAARSEAGLETTAAMVREQGAEAVVVPCDVSKPEDIARLVQVAGNVDILIHNAGIEQVCHAHEQDPDDAERQVRVNLIGPMRLTRAIVPGMLERGAGVVVMVSSMAGKSPTPFNAVYAATKHGLNGYASSLRLELLKTGVHVGTVCPGFVADTGMWANGGHTAPALFSEVSPKRVVKAVHAVIRGKPEVLVTPGPIRPMLALAQFFPRIDGFVLKNIGVLRTMRARAIAERDAGKSE
ncbi:MAG: short-subunit dehydrogenase [Myxococcota bacterium]|jgi:short-subunit dehydrogenase